MAKRRLIAAPITSGAAVAGSGALGATAGQMRPPLAPPAFSGDQPLAKRPAASCAGPAGGGAGGSGQAASLAVAGASAVTASAATAAPPARTHLTPTPVQAPGGGTGHQPVRLAAPPVLQLLSRPLGKQAHETEAGQEVTVVLEACNTGRRGGLCVWGGGRAGGDGGAGGVQLI